MEFIGLALIAVGFVACLVGGIWILVKGFQESALWGLGMLFIGPLVTLIFVIMHWENCKKPFLYYAGGFVGIIFGMVVGGMGGGA